MAAERAVEDYDIWKQMDPADAINYIKGAHTVGRDKKASKGTNAHEAIATYYDEDPSKHQLGVYDGYIQAADKFLTDKNLEIVRTEVTFCDPSGYAGTADVWAQETLTGDNWIVDWKTGGLWPESHLQITAYAQAKHWVDESTGTEILVETPEFVGGHLVGIQEHGNYKTQQVDTHNQEAYNAFKGLMAIHTWR